MKYGNENFIIEYTIQFILMRCVCVCVCVCKIYRTMDISLNVALHFHIAFLFASYFIILLIIWRI